MPTCIRAILDVRARVVAERDVGHDEDEVLCADATQRRVDRARREPEVRRVHVHVLLPHTFQYRALPILGDNRGRE